MICAAVVFINLTSFPINEHDKKTLESAKQHCPKVYKNSPCLKKFVKVGKQDYRALCGKPTSSQQSL